MPRPGAAVDEERVVGLGRRLGDGERGRVGEAVRRADHERGRTCTSGSGPRRASTRCGGRAAGSARPTARRRRAATRRRGSATRQLEPRRVADARRGRGSAKWPSIHSRVNSFGTATTKRRRPSSSTGSGLAEPGPVGGLVEGALAAGRRPRSRGSPRSARVVAPRRRAAPSPRRASGEHSSVPTADNEVSRRASVESTRFCRDFRASTLISTAVDSANSARDSIARALREPTSPRCGWQAVDNRRARRGLGYTARAAATRGCLCLSTDEAHLSAKRAQAGSASTASARACRRAPAGRSSSAGARRAASASRPDPERRRTPCERRTACSRSRDFDAVYRQGRSVSTRFLVALLVPARGRRRRAAARPGGAEGGRQAVERNRVKRQLREVWRGAARARSPPAATTCSSSRPGLAEAAESARPRLARRAASTRCSAKAAA